MVVRPDGPAVVWHGTARPEHAVTQGMGRFAQNQAIVVSSAVARCGGLMLRTAPAIFPPRVR